MSATATERGPAAAGTAPVAPGALSAGLTVTRRNLLYIRHMPGILAASAAAPLIMVLLFGYVFGSAIPLPGGGDYREFLMPGLFALVAVNGVMPSMTGMARDRERGVTDRMRSLPVPRLAVPFGYVASDVVLGAFGLALTAATGLAVGWRARDGLPAAAGAFALLLLFRYAMTWVGAVIGLAVRREETANQLSVLAFPLCIVTNAFVPTDGLPGWLRAVAEWNPVSAVVAACRELFGNPAARAPGADAAWPLEHPVAATVLWSAVLLVVFVPVGVRMFHRPD